MQIPLPPSQNRDIYNYGFNPNLNRPRPIVSSSVVYDPIGEAANSAQVLSGGNLTLKSLTIGGFSRQVAIGGDIQEAINAVSREGGGVVQLGSGTYNLVSNISLLSKVTLVGNDTTIDFGGGPYQLQMVGSNPYSVGTVSVTNDSTTITGSGTSWTDALVGRKILVGEQWYTVSVVGGVTSMTIDTGYVGSTNSGLTYVIATTINSPSLVGITLQNSSVALLKIQYADFPFMDDFALISGLVGMDIDDTAIPQILNGTVYGCGTGLTINNAPFITYFNTSIVDSTSGGGIICDKTSNSAFEVFAVQNCVGDGVSFTNVANLGVEDFSVRETTGVGFKMVDSTNTTVMDGVIENSSSDGIQLTGCSKTDFNGVHIGGSGGQGVELVSGNSSVFFSNLTIDDSTSDGLKSAATSDSIFVTTCSILNNGGYGVNIAAASCDNNLLLGNIFSSNTSGAVSDSGTTTKIKSNIGVNDN